MQKNLLYNILKVSQNLMGGSVKNRGDKDEKNFFVKLKAFLVNQLYQVKLHSLDSSGNEVTELDWELTNTPQWGS